MKRHGAEAHFLRPDGVYITTVLQPTLNFDPVRDTQETAARFVMPTGLAGPVATTTTTMIPAGHHPFMDSWTRTTTTWKSRWQSFVARIKANMAANQLVRDMNIHVPPAKAGPLPLKITDILPRPPNPNPGAIAVSSGWAPDPQSPATAAMNTVGSMPAQGDPPKTPAIVTAVNMAPQEAGFPAEFWRDTIEGGMSPLIATRGERDALYQWYTRYIPYGGSGY
jgi:hypothetical protein